MRHDVKTALEDVEDLLELADWAGDNDIRNLASLYIRAMIRGNDALCLSYLGERPGRHHQASDFFRRLYEEGYVPEDLSKYRTSISDVLQKKADMQYKSVSLSDTDFERIRKRVTRFIENAVRPHLE